MSAVPTTPTFAQPSRATPPALENGDRLTRVEFERRYRAMTGVKKAELIEGTVFMPSPIRIALHGQPHAILCTVLGYYYAKTPGLAGFADNATARIDEDNEPQPDLMLLLPLHLGGMAKADKDDYVTGPPTLVAELAASNVSIDLHNKLNVYRRSGVPEYLVWRTEDADLDWFILRDGAYVRLAPDEAGILRSEKFPGLWIDVPSLLKGDLPALFKAVDAGVATAEHSAFVAQLRG